jgi:hypothetical protein
METPVLLAGALVVPLLVAVVLALVLRSRGRSRRDLDAALLASRAETAELRERLDALTELLERQSSSMIRVDDPAYVITDAGTPRREPTVADGVVLSTAVGEPLVKVVAFGHGLRRALSPESRNRIRFEIRREIRAARRRRRQENKEFLRDARAAQRAAESSDAA